MKVSSTIKCECGFKTRFEFRKPDHFTPTSGVCHCEECGSKIQYLVKKGKDKGAVNIAHRTLEASDLLRALRSEDQKEI